MAHSKTFGLFKRATCLLFIALLFLLGAVARAAAPSLDPFAVLGIENDADESAIKKAFRRLSRQHHPDHNPGDKESERKYKEVQEAYDLLTKHRAQFEGGVFHTYDEYMRWKEEQERAGSGKKKKGKKGKASSSPSGLYTYERDGILDLTDRKEFDNALKDRSRPILLKMYASWCTHCHAMAPAFKKAALSLVEEHNVTVASVNCGENEKLCQREQVHGYPTLRLLLPKGLPGFDGSVETFQPKGPSVEAEELVEFVLSNMRNDVIAIKGPKDFKKRVLQGVTSHGAAAKHQESRQASDTGPTNANATTVWLINFSSNPNFCPPCGHMRGVFKALAGSRFANAPGKPLINLGTVDCDQSRMLCQEQEVQFYPQLRLYTLKGAVKHHLKEEGRGGPYRGVPLLVDQQQAMHFPPGAALDLAAGILEALLPERPELPDASSSVDDSHLDEVKPSTEDDNTRDEL